MMQATSVEELKLLEQEIELREQALLLKENLPHLYGQKLYRWQRKFRQNRRRYGVLTASNQSGKSAINIKTAIWWATDKEMWPALWKTTPVQFWYLYPDGGTATVEFETKWIREFLPKEALKDHPIYGWKSKKDERGNIDYIRFNSGVTIYFKTYSQNVNNLQAGSVHAIFADEEVPFDLMSELQMRVEAYDGYMRFVFTATRGQEEWRKIVEERGKEEMWKESEVDILKQQVTAYDCCFYEDGTPSTIWSIEKIENAKKLLHSEAQIARRIYGRFVKDEGLLYHGFVRKQHIIEYKDIDFNKGQVYAGVDYGSGGETGHPASICLVWVSKDHTHGVVFDIWVGEKGISTTAGSIIEKYKAMLKEHKIHKDKVIVHYDWASADLKTIANSSGFNFMSADKNHASGERIVNTILKDGMLHIMENGDWDTLAKQLETLTPEDVAPGRKKNAWDDAVDALRYAVTKIPWVYTNLKDKKPEIPVSNNPRKRHEPKPVQEETFEDEINEWASYYEFQDYDDFDF